MCLADISPPPPTSQLINTPSSESEYISPTATGPLRRAHTSATRTASNNNDCRLWEDLQHSWYQGESAKRYVSCPLTVCYCLPVLTLAFFFSYCIYFPGTLVFRYLPTRYIHTLPHCTLCPSSCVVPCCRIVVDTTGKDGILPPPSLLRDYEMLALMKSSSHHPVCPQSLKLSFAK